MQLIFSDDAGCNKRRRHRRDAPAVDQKRFILSTLVICPAMLAKDALGWEPSQMIFFFLLFGLNLKLIRWVTRKMKKPDIKKERFR
jgi:hypothetical protein